MPQADSASQEPRQPPTGLRAFVDTEIEMLNVQRDTSLNRDFRAGLWEGITSLQEVRDFLAATPVSSAGQREAVEGAILDVHGELSGEDEPDRLLAALVKRGVLAPVSSAGQGDLRAAALLIADISVVGQSTLESPGGDLILRAEALARLGVTVEEMPEPHRRETEWVLRKVEP